MAERPGARATTETPYARSFERVADVYDRVRPPFSDRVVDEVLAGLGLGEQSTVLDLGAGTGRLTRHLVGRVGRVVAVEPLPGMLRVLERGLPDVEALVGTADAIPLPDASVDAVVVGEALHWFHDGGSLREIRRVLRPAGGLAPLWTVYDRPPEGPDWMRGIGVVMEPLLAARGPDASYRGPWRSRVDGSGLFRPFVQTEERQVQRLTPAEAVELQRSTSGVARLPPAEQERVLDTLRDLLATHPETRGRQVLELPYRTIGYWTRAR